MHHYDLLAQPDWKAKSVLVVSPYVERFFFDRILNLRPTMLTIVIDDGCRADEVAMLQNLTAKGTKVSVVLGSARGIVHAKIFHIEWLTAGGNRAHTLVYGSGNATRQAFDGDFNSELMCKARLTVAKHASILEWLKQVRTAASNPTGDSSMIPPVRDVSLANGIHVRLPGLTIKDAVNKASNFDLWLQRGRLVSMFRPDASFLRIHVNLLAELPGGDLVQRVQRIGFETPKTRRLSIPYIPTLSDDGEESSGLGHWRSRYFIWTQLGDWCSDACFRNKSHLFKKVGHEARLETLTRLHDLKEPAPREKARAGFLDRVDALWSALGDSAGTYLETTRKGDLDRAVYQKLFEQRLERDLELAADTEFRDRYIDGCEVIEVPRFRMDALGWRSFVDSFMRQIHLEWLKAKSPSLIYQYIYAALEDSLDSAFDDPKTLVELVRSKWNHVIEGDDGEGIHLGQYIDLYHADH
jgi:hypothetical protein